MPSSSRVLGRVVSTSPTTCKTRSSTQLCCGGPSSNSQVQLHTPALTLGALDLLRVRAHRTVWLLPVITWQISEHTRKSKGSSAQIQGSICREQLLRSLLTIALHPETQKSLKITLHNRAGKSHGHQPHHHTVFSPWQLLSGTMGGRKNHHTPEPRSCTGAPE